MLKTKFKHLLLDLIKESNEATYKTTSEIDVVFVNSKKQAYTDKISEFIININKSEKIDQTIFLIRSNIDQDIKNAISNRHDILKNENSSVEDRGISWGIVNALKDISLIITQLEVELAKEQHNI